MYIKCRVFEHMKKGIVGGLVTYETKDLKYGVYPLPMGIPMFYSLYYSPFSPLCICADQYRNKVASELKKGVELGTLKFSQPTRPLPPPPL